MVEIDSKKELQEKLFSGAQKLADAVGGTLGPNGKHVLIQHKGKQPFTTKDGVSVARSFSLKDPFENLGASIIKQSAESTVRQAGDGTTTTTILANAIVQSARPFLASGVSPIRLQKEIEEAKKTILSKFPEISQPITSYKDIENIATISANNNKELGKLIATAVDKVGKDGSITIQESQTNETILELHEGFIFDSGLFSKEFINDERKMCLRMNDVLVLITDESISSVDDLLPILEPVARDGRPFVVVAENVEGEALAALIANTINGTLKIGAIKAPKYGEERRDALKDLALITGATFFSRIEGRSIIDAKFSDLGQAKIIESSQFETTVVSAITDAEAIQSRINLLKENIRNTSDIQTCARLQERITRLSSGMAIIRIGGNTEAEVREKKDRVEDALEAVSSANKEGVVAGGGSAFLRFSLLLEDRAHPRKATYGALILAKALAEPFARMCESGGWNADVLKEKLLTKKIVNDYRFGVDFNTGDVRNLFNDGIIDPIKVLRVSLENSVSSAIVILMSECAIIET